MGATAGGAAGGNAAEGEVSDVADRAGAQGQLARQRRSSSRRWCWCSWSHRFRSGRPVHVQARTEADGEAPVPNGPAGAERRRGVRRRSPAREAGRRGRGPGGEQCGWARRPAGRVAAEPRLSDGRLDEEAAARSRAGRRCHHRLDTARCAPGTETVAEMSVQARARAILRRAPAQRSQWRCDRRFRAGASASRRRKAGWSRWATSSTVRIGPISVFALVIILCLAVLGVLSSRPHPPGRRWRSARRSSPPTTAATRSSGRSFYAHADDVLAQVPCQGERCPGGVSGPRSRDGRRRAGVLRHGHPDHAEHLARRRGGLGAHQA